MPSWVSVWERDRGIGIPQYEVERSSWFEFTFGYSVSAWMVRVIIMVTEGVVEEIHGEHWF